MASDYRKEPKNIIGLIADYFQKFDLSAEFEKRLLACFAPLVSAGAPDVDREIHIPEDAFREMQKLYPDTIDPRSAMPECLKIEKEIFDILRADARDDSTSSTQSPSFREAMDDFSTQIWTSEVLWMITFPKLQRFSEYISGLDPGHSIPRSVFSTPRVTGRPPRYPYCQLSRESLEFRVLAVVSDPDPSAPIECELNHCYGSGNMPSPAFVALSYLWGDTDPHHAIIIRVCGHPVAVTPNLHAALRHLRHPRMQRYLWVDALCINQADIAEKTSQIPLMASIYETAAFVVIWLGEEEDRADVAMKLMLDFENGRVGALGSIEHRDAMAAMARLLKRPYWNRIWVIQEVVLARHAFVCCGKYAIGWENFALFLFSLDLQGAIMDQDMSPVLPFMSCKKNAEHGALPLAKLWVQKKCEISISCFDVLRLSRQRRATEQHDHIFGLMGIAKLMPIQIDYSMPLPSLYLTLVRNFISESGKLDVLSLCKLFDPPEPSDTGSHRRDMAIDGIQDCERTSENTTKGGTWADPSSEVVMGAEEQKKSNEDIGVRSLPSWVPRWGYLGLTDADYILLNDDLRAKYKASGDSRAEIQFLNAVQVQALSIRGVLVDRVKAVTGSIPYGFEHPTEHESTADCVARNQRCLRRDWETWKTFTGNSENPSPYGADADVQRQAFLEMERFGSQLDSNDIGDRFVYHMLGQASGDFEIPMDMGKQISGLLETIMRCMFFVSEGGYIGRGAPSVKQGDLVCVFYGGDVPFVIRPVGSSYYLLGECYLHGMMHGEAIRMRDEGKLQERTFILI